MAWENRQGREVKEPNHVYKFFKKNFPFSEEQINSVIDVVINNGCVPAMAYLQETYEISMNLELKNALCVARMKDNRFYDTHRYVTCKI